MAYIIQNKMDPELAWNNTSQSWEAEDFDTFNDDSLPLPQNGKWIQVINKCDEEKA
tara:strand:+ start:516 stop:683 length:168 start_codon:yes stop_codon:yes gene_type:complete